MAPKKEDADEIPPEGHSWLQHVQALWGSTPAMPGTGEFQRNKNKKELNKSKRIGTKKLKRSKSARGGKILKSLEDVSSQNTAPWRSRKRPQGQTALKIQNFPKLPGLEEFQEKIPESQRLSKKKNQPQKTKPKVQRCQELQDAELPKMPRVRAAKRVRNSPQKILKNSLRPRSDPTPQDFVGKHPGNARNGNSSKK